MGRRSMRRGTMGYSRGTHSSSSNSGWRRRRNGRSLDDVRLNPNSISVLKLMILWMYGA
jgi:hypothetical protein